MSKKSPVSRRRGLLLSVVALACAAPAALAHDEQTVGGKRTAGGTMFEVPVAPAPLTAPLPSARVAGDRLRRAARSRSAYVRVGGGGIVDIPVSFQVENVNRSKVPCQSDGRTYTIRGRLVAPASVVASGVKPAVTVYLQGSGSGSFWHFQRAPGHDYAADMARLGHASLAIDALGYGDSDIPNGNDVCVGSWADTIHQVIGKLRGGQYDAAPHRAPSFARVAVGGHSLGGLVAEVFAYSFPADADALILAEWADQGIPPDSPVLPAVARFGERCATGGEPKRDGAAGGYAFIFNSEELRGFFYNADPDVVGAFIPAYERDICGLAASGHAVAINQALVSTITAPTLLIYGDHGALAPGSGDLQRERLTASRDVSVVTIAEAGHQLTLQRSAPEFRAEMSAWLKARGF